MSLRSVAYTLLVGLVVLVAVSLAAGSVLGQPILLSYVETGSMEPTPEPGDGFVAIPAQLTGPPEEGDVVVFRAEEIQDGGLTTHRIVGETDRGYISRGDANPFTDQDNDEPPVKDAQIVAVAWAPGGEVFVVPHLGTTVQAVQGSLQWVQRNLAGALGTRALLGPQGLAYLLFGITTLYYLVGEYRSREGKDRGRRSRTRTPMAHKLLDTTFLIHRWGGRESVKSYLASRPEGTEYVTAIINLTEIAVGRTLVDAFDPEEIGTQFE